MENVDYNFGFFIKNSDNYKENKISSPLQNLVANFLEWEQDNPEQLENYNKEGKKIGELCFKRNSYRQDPGRLTRKYSPKSTTVGH